MRIGQDLWIFYLWLIFECVRFFLTQTLCTIAVYKQQDGADFSHRIDNSFQIYSRLVFSVQIPSKMARKVVGILTKELLRRPRTLCEKVQTEEYFFNTDEYVTTFICNIF